MGDKEPLGQYWMRWIVHILFAILFVPLGAAKASVEWWECVVVYRPKRTGDKR